MPTGISEADCLARRSQLDLTEQSNMPCTHLEGLSACSVFCSKDHSATDTGFPLVFPSIFNPVSHTLLNSVLWPVLSKQFSSWSERQSSARPPRPEVSQSHPRVAKRSFDRSSSRRPCPEVSQRHPRVADHPPTDLKTVSFRCHNRSSARRPCHRFFRAISAWRSSHLSALRHGDPAQRCLRGIPAWQRGYLSGLRHGAPSHNHLSGIPAWRRGLLSACWHGTLAHRCLGGILAESL